MNSGAGRSAVQENKAGGRRMLILLVVFFAAPIVLVMLMYRQEWRPAGSSHGDLISPARLLQMPERMMDMHGRTVKSDIWRDKWSMVYIAGDCDDACGRHLHDMRQLHASLAKDIDRVQRILLVDSGNLAEVQKAYPDLIIISQPPDGLEKLARQFDVAGMPAEKGNRIYLVDPLGNLMMSFPDELPAVEIRKDIGRLLRYSWAG